MTVNTIGESRRLLLLLACFPLASCSDLLTNARQSTEQRPAASGAWAGNGNLVVSAVRSTGVAAIRQPVTTAALGLAVLWHRPREVVRANIPVDPAADVVLPDQPGTENFEALLDSKGYRPVESGKLTWLVDGSGFFPELDRRMKAARKSIDLQVFIFDNDDIGVRYADRLKSRSPEVRVRVLFDDLGSAFAQTTPPETPAPQGFTPPADMGVYLRQNSELRLRRTTNPWLVCDHTKLLVFDGQTAILGGMNIGREYFSEWHDLMVRVDGPIVGSLSREFNRAWRKAGPLGDLALFRKPARLRRPPPVADGIPLRLLRTDPAEGRYEILESTLLAIRSARKRIWIENPYLASDEIGLALESAARRGVDVRVILPAKGDSAIMDIGNLATARGLINAGAKVLRYPRMTHMKVMICDNWASVGSANLDTLSMRINRELNLSFSDPATIRELERKVFLPDFSRSRRMRLADTDSAIAPVAEAIADQL